MAFSFHNVEGKIPFRYSFTGDVDACKKLVGFAKKRQYKLIKGMGFQGLKTSTPPPLELGGGILIENISCYGLNTIKIHVPMSEGEDVEFDFKMYGELFYYRIKNLTTAIITNRIIVWTLEFDKKGFVPGGGKMVLDVDVENSTIYYPAGIVKPTEITAYIAEAQGLIDRIDAGEVTNQADMWTQSGEVSDPVKGMGNCGYTWPDRETQPTASSIIVTANFNELIYSTAPSVVGVSHIMEPFTDKCDYADTGCSSGQTDWHNKYKPADGGVILTDYTSNLWFGIGDNYDDFSYKSICNPFSGVKDYIYYRDSTDYAYTELTVYDFSVTPPEGANCPKWGMFTTGRASTNGDLGYFEVDSFFSYGEFSNRSWMDIRRGLLVYDSGILFTGNSRVNYDMATPDLVVTPLESLYLVESCNVKKTGVECSDSSGCFDDPRISKVYVNWPESDGSESDEEWAFSRFDELPCNVDALATSYKYNITINNEVEEYTPFNIPISMSSFIVDKAVDTQFNQNWISLVAQVDIRNRVRNWYYDSVNSMTCNGDVVVVGTDPYDQIYSYHELTGVLVYIIPPPTLYDATLNESTGLTTKTNFFNIHDYRTASGYLNPYRVLVLEEYINEQLADLVETVRGSGLWLKNYVATFGFTYYNYVFTQGIITGEAP